MSRLYSGNINAFEAARSRLRDMGFVVMVHEVDEALLVIVKDLRECCYGLKHFYQPDEDVRYNAVTRFLITLADQLETWR